MENDDNRLIIEVSGEGYEDYNTLKEKLNENNKIECIYTNGKEGKSTRSSFDYNFAFVNQNNNGVDEIIKNIIDSTSKTKICIAVHKTRNPIDKVNEGIKTSLNKEKDISSPKKFNHAPSEPLWNSGLKPFIESIGNNFSDYQKQFDNLWNMLAPSAADEAHSLRTQILTPFIPFHLYYQDDKENKENDWKDILKSCCMEINKKKGNGENIIEAKLDELLKLKADLPENMKKAQTTFNKLKEYFAQNEEECIKAEECHTKIKEFADCLENIVNFIEFGETAE
ncbi:MAG: hypothetical protein HZA06_00885 [Nitrospirae bacterium]|nr:hypothetical protein [Nitrospirota bacterium]